MFLFSRGKLPKLIHKLGNNEKDHDLENEISTKRKRADSKVSNVDANDSLISENSNSETKPISSSRHKLRRTKKHENLREEWQRYHNNFIPVLLSDPTDPFLQNALKSTAIDNSFQQTLDYNKLKYAIKDNFNKNNYIKLNNQNSKINEHHIAKKRRLLSFIL